MLVEEEHALTSNYRGGSTKYNDLTTHTVTLKIKTDQLFHSGELDHILDGELQWSTR